LEQFFCGFGCLDFLADRLIAVSMFLGPSSGTGDSLKLLGGLGTQGDYGVRGERSFDLWRQSVNGEALLLTNITADRRQLSPWKRKTVNHSLTESLIVLGGNIHLNSGDLSESC